MRFLLPLLFLGLPVCASAGESPAPAAPPTSKAAPTEAQIIENFNRENPGIRIDAANHWLEFDAKVCLREADMLEDLVCAPMTREHESILVSDAKPSRVHLGLLLLGLEPGAPRSVVWVGPNGDEPKAVPATGPEVALSFVYKVKETKDGKEVEREVEMPAHRWLKDAKTGKESTTDRWLFTGSRMGKTVDGAPFYAADGEGNLVSTVHFGDETLAPHSSKTKENSSEGEDLVCNTPLIPEVGAKVVVRVKPVKKEAAKDGKAPEASGEKATTPAK